jgi:AcrR family transcriptional regulator
MPRGPYQKSDLTRERILEAATELFAQRGYAGTGVDRLAERSGIAKTAIYYHFGNKEGLLAAVLARAAAVWIENIRRAAERAGTPEEALDQALAGMRAMVDERPWILKLLLLLTLEVADEKPEIRKAMGEIFLRARQTIVAGLREALGIDVPGADAVGNVMLGLLQAAVVGRELDPQMSLATIFDDMRNIVVFMVASRLDPSLGATASLVIPAPPVAGES